MAEVNLLGTLPKTIRDANARVLDKDKNRALALKFGEEYFDGPREQGYGGYRYDGRWVPVAERIVDRYGLKAGDRVLDVGCAKGFLVKDLMAVCPGLQAYGLDISDYALRRAPAETRGRYVRGTAERLPFADGSFSAVLAINVIHNLDRAGCIAALRELERLAPPGKSFVQVDAYRDIREKAAFEDWMLTAKSYYRPEEWIALFAEAGYSGDHYWTILELDPETTRSRHIER